MGISIHALLAESDDIVLDAFQHFVISIHALLAESDGPVYHLGQVLLHFNPRSPCGERHYFGRGLQPACAYFNPRSPCGERPAGLKILQQIFAFQSTLSLRRATLPCIRCMGTRRFQSTLSLRRATDVPFLLFQQVVISIHALLAESDSCSRSTWMSSWISIHALLAESDLAQQPCWPLTPYFNPRSPCGERRVQRVNIVHH